MAQFTLDTNKLKPAIDGNKTYLLLASGAAVIVLNHFGLLPPEYVPAGLDPNSWVRDLFVLATGAAGRSALKKLETDTMTPEQAAKADAVANSVQRIGDELLKRQQPQG